MSATRVPRRRLNGILLLDKPIGLSSNQALQEVRRLFNADKAGHTGSLDPLASGMLPICFGEATKLSGLLLDSDKRYVAHIRLGQKTTTGDAEGAVIAQSEPGLVSLVDLHAVVPRFVGDIRQIPPMYSALKHQGRRLYELARAGEEIERPARHIRIHELKLLALEAGELSIEVACSKGTYIRTLAEDLAAAVGQCAHLSGLRRLEVHPFGRQRMWAWAELEALAAAGLGTLDACLLPMRCGLAGWPEIYLEQADLVRLARGQAVQVTDVAKTTAPGEVAVLDAGGLLRAIAKLDRAGRLSPARWLGGEILA
ncbi:MAG: tRNA pseudouridine(55) synthase TruB [Panacagrimonas sp.]